MAPTLWIYDFDGEGIEVCGPTRPYVRGPAIEFHFCHLRAASHFLAGTAGSARQQDSHRAGQSRLSKPEPVAKIPIDHFDGLTTLKTS